MRLRVLELPAQPNGEDNRYPFIYVVDDCDQDQADETQDSQRFTVGGAEGVIVFQDRVEIPAVDP
jgi:hypothetical protein